MASSHETTDAGVERPVTVLVYSDDVNTRTAVRTAVGRRAARDLPTIDWREVATRAALIDSVDAADVDLFVLDGEAVPAGGLGLAKQIKDEVDDAPPILVLTGRPDDAWLATWSRADAAVPHPLDPVALRGTVEQLLRQKLAARA